MDTSSYWDALTAQAFDGVRNMDITSECVECFSRQHEIKVILFTFIIDVPGLIMHDLSVHIIREKHIVFIILDFLQLQLT